jgi:hypothetical protein
MKKQKVSQPLDIKYDTTIVEYSGGHVPSMVYPCPECAVEDYWHNHADDCSLYKVWVDRLASHEQGWDDGFERGYNQAVRNVLRAIEVSGLDAVVGAVFPIPNNRDEERLNSVLWELGHRNGK